MILSVEYKKLFERLTKAVGKTRKKNFSHIKKVVHCTFEKPRKISNIEQKKIKQNNSLGKHYITENVKP